MFSEDNYTPKLLNLQDVIITNIEKNDNNRYKCKECGKNFHEQNTFLPRFQHITSRVPMKILDSLRNMRT